MSNRNLLAAIAQAIEQYQSGGISLADTQATIEANASTLDSTVADLAAELRAVDADLERIQHGFRAEEQKAAAMDRLERLLPRLLDAESDRPA